MTTGIYCIENVINKKRYIGYSNNIEKRCNQHLSALRKKKHLNSYLQKAYNKYGENSFEILILYVLEENISQECLGEKERFYIKHYKSNERNFGYNLNLGGKGGMLGWHQTNENKKKLSERMTGENNPNYNGKSITEESKEKTRKKVLGKERMSQSSSLQGKIRNNNCEYFGVTKRVGKTVIRWESNIQFKRKQYYLGRFENKEAAAKEYDMQALYFYGDDARINFPQLIDEYKEKQGHKYTLSNGRKGK